MSKLAVAPHTEAKGYPMEDGIFGVNMEITRRGITLEEYLAEQ